ncbi:FAD binding domain-containing protein [Mycena sanguinolenta]|nr:FAD binding domain-containing protein [Mycena sanguinolenta]
MAYQLARFGCKPYLMEQEDKSKLVHYGRAATIWPRTLEILDQLDLAEGILQMGHATRDSMHFRDGRRAPGGYLFANRMDKLGDTFYKFAIQLRQRRTEEHITTALKSLGVDQHVRTRLESFSIDENAEDGYPVTVQARNLDNDNLFQIKTKYLIGADGAKSTVRSLAGIPFNGERTTTRWVRIDCIVKTTMPYARCLCSIDSKSHGQVLWCPLDDGFTRIGYVFPEELVEKYGGPSNLTQEVAAKEAILALKPFELEFVTIQWFTTYGVGQAIAETFFTQGRIFLVGDACHTHTSGAAQGLNTGIQDAVNLGWKLALDLKGLGSKSLLESYTEERKPSAQMVIDNDKTISMLVSGKYPPRFQGRTEEPRDLLTEWYTDWNIQMFTLGLGVSYARNLLNADKISSAATIVPGLRGPDVYLTNVGIGTPIRLHQALKNDGKFNIVVFAGNPLLSHAALTGLTSALAAPGSFTHSFPTEHAFRFTTLAAAVGNSATDVLGLPPFGRLYFDPDARAHAIYGVELARGAIIVFRPDGWVGCALPLDGLNELRDYFKQFLLSASDIPFGESDGLEKSRL